MTSKEASRARCRMHRRGRNAAALGGTCGGHSLPVLPKPLRVSCCDLHLPCSCRSTCPLRARRAHIAMAHAPPPAPCTALASARVRNRAPASSCMHRYAYKRDPSDPTLVYQSSAGGRCLPPMTKHPDGSCRCSKHSPVKRGCIRVPRHEAPLRVHVLTVWLQS